MNDDIRQLPAPDLLAWAINRFGDRFAVLTSFQDEGMVILDMAVCIDRRVRVMTIDTGMLPAETQLQMDAVRQHYGIGIEVLRPHPDETAAMLTRHGDGLMYRERTLRLLCCQVRKVRPLDRAMTSLDAWAVGLRRGQSEARSLTARVEEIGGRWKLSPLSEWSRQQVDTYLKEHGVPRHPLYMQGYTSIGCAPCTRAVAAGEPERAGRWWWERDSDRECGLHATPDGRFRRSLDVLVEEIAHA